jgi:hypothetical protein
VFNLNSAYLTGAWNNGLQIDVQGFIGGTLTYDSIYTINTTGHILINFNHAGVDEVNFTSSGGIHNPSFSSFGEQFVMDNLSITPVPEPTNLLFVTVGIGGMIFVCCQRLLPISANCREIP